MEKKLSKPNINLKSFFSKENMPLLSLICFCILAVVFIIVSHVAFSISLIVACVMVILETLLAACFNKIPLWIHGLIFIAQIVAGIIASQVPFMVLMAFVYVAAIAFLFIWEHHA